MKGFVFGSFLGLVVVGLGFIGLLVLYANGPL